VLLVRHADVEALADLTARQGRRPSPRPVLLAKERRRVGRQLHRVQRRQLLRNRRVRRVEGLRGEREHKANHGKAAVPHLGVRRPPVGLGRHILKVLPDHPQGRAGGDGGDRDARAGKGGRPGGDGRRDGGADRQGHAADESHCRVGRGGVEQAKEAVKVKEVWVKEGSV